MRNHTRPAADHVPSVSSENASDALSRFGSLEGTARRILERLLRPALVRQTAVNAHLRDQLAELLHEIQVLKDAAHGTAAGLGELQYRVDLIERRLEHAQANALLARVTLPPDGRRATVVAHYWKTHEERRVLCSSATGSFDSLLEVAAVGLERYARRHRWDLVLSREALAARPASWNKLPLVRSLFQEYDVVAWIDCDTVIVDFERDIGEVLEADKDFYVVEQRGSDPPDCVANTGIFIARASEWTQRFFDEVWARDDSIDHRWWDNAAFMRVLGYDLEASPIRHAHPTRWTERVRLLDPAWNSIPYWARSPAPRINHYGAIPLKRRRLLMLDDLTQIIVKRRASNPLAGVDSRDDLPSLFNRLGLIGMGAAVGVGAGDFSAWILHRWYGWRLTSIDPWAPDNDGRRASADIGERQNELYVSTKHRLAPFGDRSAMWKMTGEEAARHIDDSALDFVYLGLHEDEASVIHALSTWEAKVHRGGIIAGHPYIVGEPAEGAGVNAAVDAFFASRALEVHETVLDRPRSSWWVVRD